jgi:hypothetical protein
VRAGCLLLLQQLQGCDQVSQLAEQSRLPLQLLLLLLLYRRCLMQVLLQRRMLANAN